MSEFKKEIIKDYKALIMDLDGTVLDSMKVWNEVDEIFLRKRGFEVDEEYTNTVKSCSMRQSAEYTVKRYNLSETPEEVIAEWEATVEEEYRSKIKLKKGVYEFLHYAKEQGLKITSATALARKNAVAALKNNNVYELFDNITTLDDVDIEINKFEPDIFLIASEKVGAKSSEAIVFEDVKGAIEGAAKGGFKTVLVYDDISAIYFEEASKMADHVIRDWTLI
ncbi:MAG: HAD family phosphatase [Clostridiales bacterium]|nr:HAD family phosphatase [Clostridiales bacterium]